MDLLRLKKELAKFSNRDKAKVLSSFFKTGKGQYGEGDVFIGVSVANVRIIAKKYQEVSLEIVKGLLLSKIHEERLLGVLILVLKYEKTNNPKVAEFYLNHNKKINNWDLVDLSCPKILGHYYFERDRSNLYLLANSENLWERRTAIVSTYYFIRRGQYLDTLKISEILLKDKEDLMNKAVGWMLREVGKRDSKLLVEFLKNNYSKLSRTTLRYSIEKFSYTERQRFLKGEFD